MIATDGVHMRGIRGEPRRPIGLTRLGNGSSDVVGAALPRDARDAEIAERAAPAAFNYRLSMQTHLRPGVAISFPCAPRATVTSERTTEMMG
jgi:hypothetical protein